jgi:hypothetical protein
LNITGKPQAHRFVGHLLSTAFDGLADKVKIGWNIHQLWTGLKQLSRQSYQYPTVERENTVLLATIDETSEAQAQEFETCNREGGVALKQEKDLGQTRDEIVRREQARSRYVYIL